MCSLSGRYDNPVPTQLLAPIDWLKILAQEKVNKVTVKKELVSTISMFWMPKNSGKNLADFNLNSLEFYSNTVYAIQCH